MTTTNLTPAQHAILTKAINTSGGKIDWFPDNIKGGARKKVLDGMFNRALITTEGTDWFVTAEAYDALGLTRPGVNKTSIGQFEANLDQIIANAEGAPAAMSDPELEAAVIAAEQLQMLEDTGAVVRREFLLLARDDVPVFLRPVDHRPECCMLVCHVIHGSLS